MEDHVNSAFQVIYSQLVAVGFQVPDNGTHDYFFTGAGTHFDSHLVGEKDQGTVKGMIVSVKTESLGHYRIHKFMHGHY